MMKTSKLMFLILVILNVNIEITHADKGEITWFTADFPPFSIVNSPDKNSAILNFIKEKIEKSLKGNWHVTIVANPKRIFHEIKLHDRVIYATASKTKEREKHLLFSVPYVIVLPNNLIILKKNISLIKPYLVNGEFLFNKALEESDISVVFSIGRQYGRVINRVIGKHKNNRNLKVYYSNYFKEAFIDVINGRIDCAIGHPNESEYFLKILKIDDEILEYPFKGEEKYLKGYIVLPKTEWGEKTLEIINQVLLKYRNSEEFHTSNERWLNEKRRKLYRKYVEEFYKDAPLQ